jgi:hypothetical protein
VAAALDKSVGDRRFDERPSGVPRGPLPSRDRGADRRRPGAPAAADSHVTRVAEYLVEAGRFPDRAAALDFLLDHKRPEGAALLSRLRGHVGKRGDREMSLEEVTDELRRLRKRLGRDADVLAKRMVATGSAGGFSDATFTEVIKAFARHHSLSFEQAFRELGAAHAVVKKKELAAVAPPMPVRHSDEAIYRSAAKFAKAAGESSTFEEFGVSLDAVEAPDSEDEDSVDETGERVIDERPRFLTDEQLEQIVSALQRGYERRHVRVTPRGVPSESDRTKRWANY